MIHIILKNSALDKAIHESVSAMENGEVIAYPTETFYGLGVRFDRLDSLKRLYALKKRPAEKAMPLIIGGIDMLQQIVSGDWLGHMPSPARSLMERLWPGPLTLLIPAKKELSEYLTAGTGKIAVRIPGDSFALHLAQKAGFPFTATSANISGMPPADNADSVIKYFRDGIDLLIDSGKTSGGLPSTIVDVSEDKLRMVRNGAADVSIL